MDCLLSCCWSASTCAHVPKVKSLYQLCCPTKTHSFATNSGLVHVILVCCHWIAGESEFGTNTRRIGFTLTTQIAAPTLTRWISLQARRHHRHRTWKTDVGPKNDGPQIMGVLSIQSWNLSGSRVWPILAATMEQQLQKLSKKDRALIVVFIFIFVLQGPKRWRKGVCKRWKPSPGPQFPITLIMKRTTSSHRNTYLGPL